MTKFEFLGDLSRLIADLPEEDREQAMEYYEDYFADAGPEKEQEIIKDFISPAYIAEQLREASAQRQKNALTLEDEPEEPKAGEKPAVFSRKSAAQAKKNAAAAVSYASTQTSATQASAPTQSQAMPVQATQTAAPAQSQAAPAQAQTATTTQAKTAPAQGTQATAPVQSQTTPTQGQTSQTTVSGQSQAATTSEGTSQTPVSPAASDASNNSSASMRNPIFQQGASDSSKEEEMLALKKKTKVDIKSINANTSKIDKKLSREEAKQAAADKKEYNATVYDSKKKTMVIILLIITCPISLTIVGVILGLFLLAFGVVIGCVVLGIATLAVSVISLLLAILSLLTAHIPNSILSLGGALLLFSLGIGICYADFKLLTRVIPSAYFNVLILINNIKASLDKFAMK